MLISVALAFMRLSLPKGEGRVRVGSFDGASDRNPSPPAFGRRGDLWRGRQASPLEQEERRVERTVATELP